MQRTPVNPWNWSLNLGFNPGEVIEGAQRQLICAGQTSVDGEGNPQHLDDMRGQMAALADRAELSLPDVKRKNVDGEIRFDAKSLGLFLKSKLDNVYAMDVDTNVRLHSDEKTKLGKPWSLGSGLITRI